MCQVARTSSDCGMSYRPPKKVDLFRGSESVLDLRPSSILYPQQDLDCKSYYAPVKHPRSTVGSGAGEIGWDEGAESTAGKGQEP